MEVNRPVDRQRVSNLYKLYLQNMKTVAEILLSIDVSAIRAFRNTYDPVHLGQKNTFLAFTLFLNKQEQRMIHNALRCLTPQLQLISSSTTVQGEHRVQTILQFAPHSWRRSPCTRRHPLAKIFCTFEYSNIHSVVVFLIHFRSRIRNLI